MEATKLDGAVEVATEGGGVAAEVRCVSATGADRRQCLAVPPQYAASACDLVATALATCLSSHGPGASHRT